MEENASAFCAAEYDEKIKKTLPYYEDFYKQVTDIVKIPFHKPLHWLDIGCGTGKMAESAFETVDIERFVFCDHSEQMIEIAKKRFGHKNAKFKTASLMEVKETASFDVVTAIQVFHYFQMEERIKAVQKCYDALRPNGLFLHLKTLHRIVKQESICF